MNEKGIAPILAILLLVLAMGGGIYLVQQPLFSSPQAGFGESKDASSPGFVDGQTVGYSLSDITVSCTTAQKGKPTISLQWQAFANNSMPAGPFTVHYRDKSGGGEIKVGTTDSTKYTLTEANGLIVGHSYGFVVSAPGEKGGVVYTDGRWSDQKNGWKVFACPGATAVPSGGTQPGQTTIRVSKLQNGVRGGIYETFFTTKENEIAYLTQRGYKMADTPFTVPSAQTSGAVMAKRLTKLIEGTILERTWAADPADLARFKTLGYKESADADFYVFLTQKPGTIAISRWKATSGSGVLRTYYTFAPATTAVTTGWVLDKQNVFYVYP